MLNISNFVLELINIIFMKKSIIIFVIVALILLTTGWFFYSSMDTLKWVDYLQFAIIGIVIVFAIFVGIKRMKSFREKEPVEDEMSKKILQKTSSISYYVSLYMWIFLIFIKDRIKFETEELIGMGVLLMALIFALTWLVLNFKGIKSE